MSLDVAALSASARRPARLAPVVAVPVRNEAERIAELIAALGRQSWLAGGDDVLPVVMVFNNCSDDSAVIAAAAAALDPRLALHPVTVNFPPAVAHVGSARRLALEVARRLLPESVDGVLLTTDADARPRAGWIEANLAAIAAGADVVGGRIVGDATEEAALGSRFVERARAHALYAELCDRITATIDPLDHDPLPRHHDHTGASLAVRATAHDRVGGLPPLAFREDLAFVSRLRAAGARLRHDPAVEVEVSARTVGRAAGGMADCLRHWVDLANAEAPHLVEAPARVVARARLRSYLRSAGFGDGGGQDLASLLGIPARDWRLRQADGSFRAYLVERFAPDEPDAPATMPVAEAIAELEARLLAFEGFSHAA
ncbi:glycosyltransferase [Jiella sonneratiae]|uniref:Glycosyltransferase n=1 Tax=Jiella sonneratiae TaxID=2816856 RepID=A0ABS3J9W8_9HYPH|nr:glycosyltransferase [Jiella sonneratiae]